MIHFKIHNKMIIVTFTLYIMYTLVFVIDSFIQV